MHTATKSLFVVLLLTAGQDVAGQWGPNRGVAGFVGVDLVTIHSQSARIGFSAFAPAFGPVEFYGAIDRLAQANTFQGLVAIRARPHANYDWPVNWYVGGGWAVRSDELRKAAIAGVELKLASGRPYLEVRFHGPIETLEGQLEAFLGFALLLPGG